MTLEEVQRDFSDEVYQFVKKLVEEEGLQVEDALLLVSTTGDAQDDTEKE